MRLWIFIALINAGIVILLLARLPSTDPNEPFNRNEIRWQEQIEKLHKNSTRNIDVLFLGSSSMYNAIDEDLFQSLTHKSALRLALFGDFGVYGDYQLLKRWLKYSRNTPEAIIIWHSYDVWPRGLKQREVIVANGESSEMLMFYWNRMINKTFSRSSLHFPVVWAATLLKSTLHKNIDIYRHNAFLRTFFLKFIPLSTLEVHRTDHTRTAELEREIYWSKIYTDLGQRKFAPSYDNTYWLSRIISLADSIGCVVWISHSPMNDKVLEKTNIVLNMSLYNKALDQYIKSFSTKSLKMLNLSHIFYKNFDGDIYHVEAQGREHVTRTIANQYNTSFVKHDQ